jgi:peptidoglycan/LPS O-acetylase OafA/YrhL
VGVASYSLYVWHTRLMEHLIPKDAFPDPGWAAVVITIPLSIAIAFASYRLIEAPFLRLRRRWSTASAPIAHAAAA